MESTRVSRQPSASCLSIRGSIAELLAHHAFDEVAEEGGLGVAILAALDLLAEAMGLELGDDLVEIDPGHVHLIERLHGGKARGASGGRAVLRLASPRHGG